MDNIQVTEPSNDYELIDSGNGFKLERFGQVILSRPDPQVLWDKKVPKEWDKAHASFEKRWSIKKDIPKEWTMVLSGLSFHIKLSSFKHVGLFPEQEGNWHWIEDCIKKNGQKAKVLNLFGYTGGATLASLRAGAEVSHVDGSKVSLSWARKNAELSKLDDKKVRWILDDALQFVKREVRRGNTYDAIIMDPPLFGRGPKGEVWKIESHLDELLKESMKLLSFHPLFFLLNGYAAGYSHIAYKNNLLSMESLYGGKVDSGELAIRESAHGRLLPAGIFARWSRFL